MKQPLHAKQFPLSSSAKIPLGADSKQFRPVETAYSDVINYLKSHSLKPDKKVVNDLFQKLKTSAAVED